MVPRYLENILDMWKASLGHMNCILIKAEPHFSPQNLRHLKRLKCSYGRRYHCLGIDLTTLTPSGQFRKLSSLTWIMHMSLSPEHIRTPVGSSQWDSLACHGATVLLQLSGSLSWCATGQRLLCSRRHTSCWKLRDITSFGNTTARTGIQGSWAL